MYFNFSDQVKIILKRQNITMQDMAEEMDITRQTMSNWLKNNSFTESQMRKIAAILNVDFTLSLGSAEVEYGPKKHKNSADKLPFTDGKKQRGRPKKRDLSGLFDDTEKIHENQENQGVFDEHGNELYESSPGAWRIKEQPKSTPPEPDHRDELIGEGPFKFFKFGMVEDELLINPWRGITTEMYPHFDPYSGFAYRYMPLGQAQYRQE
jgi:transcriptional regulator with XRE-family HTH domain